MGKCSILHLVTVVRCLHAQIFSCCAESFHVTCLHLLGSLLWRSIMQSPSALTRSNWKRYFLALSSRALKKVHLILLLWLALPVYAQKDFTRIYGTGDQTVPTPTFIGVLGQKDPGALQELIDYLEAVNITDWKGMQASGRLTDISGNSDPASLSILNGDHFRLDVETPNGPRSTRVSGSTGKTLESDGKSFLIPPVTAKAGLLAFPRLLASTFPSANAAFIDRGWVQIDGKTMHRITAEEPVFDDSTNAAQHDINVTDLYFDPATHLLLKSASAVQLDPTDRQRYLIVLTYGGYQKVKDSLLPLSYSQTLNGQPQWTLQLNDPNLQPSVNISYFQF